MHSDNDKLPDKKQAPNGTVNGHSSDLELLRFRGGIGAPHEDTLSKGNGLPAQNSPISLPDEVARLAKQMAEKMFRELKASEKLTEWQESIKEREEWGDPEDQKQGKRKEDPLPKLLRNYSIVLVGKNTAVAYWKDENIAGGGRHKVMQLITLGAFNTYNANKSTVVEDSEGNEKHVGVTGPFIKRARRFEGLTYAPGQGPVVHNHLNMWRGFGVKATRGDWSLMKQHMLEVLAGGNQEQFDYLTKWTAWTFQHPGEQAEVVVVMRGLKGGGKGVYGRSMCRIFGSHGLQISNPEHLVGKHNKHLQHCSFLFADEAFWAGDKKSEGALKRLVTESTLTIEPKGIDMYAVDNCLHIVMAGNDKWAVPASFDERRFAVLDMSGHRHGEVDYFKKLYSQLDHGGLGAMLSELSAMDLGDWHPRYDVPQTKGLAEQKLHSMTGLDAVIHSLANDGVLPCRIGQMNDVVSTMNEEQGFGFIAAAKRTTPSLRHTKAHIIKRELIKEWGCKEYDSNGKRGLKFPPLSELRSRFAQKYGEQEWLYSDKLDWEIPQDGHDG